LNMAPVAIFKNGLSGPPYLAYFANGQ